MKTGFELFRNGALAVMFGLGAIGLTACGEDTDQTPPPPVAPSDDGYGYDDSRDGLDDMGDDAERNTRESYEDMKEEAEEAGDAVDDAYDDMSDEAEDAADDAGDAADDAADDMRR